MPALSTGSRVCYEDWPMEKFSRFGAGISRLSAVLMLGMALSGCGEKETPEEQPATVGEQVITVNDQPVATPPPAETALPAPVENDYNLDEFLLELRTAVGRKDMPAIAALMTPNFGYSLNPPMEGAGVFQYWDENNLWGELFLVVKEPFLDAGGWRVAPPEFVDPAANYTGYRAGLVRTPEGWKFAYFVQD